MKSTLVPKIDKPCEREWSPMRGDEKQRFCDHCQLNVHNLSAMSEAEQRELFANRGQRMCISYSCPPNAIPVKFGTWRFLQRILLPLRTALALLAAVFPLVFSGCATSQPPKVTPAPVHDCKQIKTTSNFKGGIMMEPPLWRRILFFWENF